MAKTPRIYTRLCRSPLNVGTYKSLWLAADHLMQVDSSGYTENYQRFQFSDIQGFFITDSSRRLYWNLFWGAIALVAGIVFISGLVDQDRPVVSAVFLAISVNFLVWNNALGRSCRVYLVTKVQTVPLGSLARRGKANKVLGRIQPLIEAAQSGLTTVSRVPPQPPAVAPVTVSPEPPPLA